MLGIDYGSDSEEDDSVKAPAPPVPAPAPAASSSKGIGSALPPPKSSSSKRRHDGPVRITVEALKFKEDDEAADDRETKKARLDLPSATTTQTGKKTSSLLAMLPAPKQSVPSTKPATATPPQRVLGGGAANGAFLFDSGNGVSMADEEADESGADGQTRPTLFLPPAMAKNKAAPAKSPLKPSAPPVDFFSISSSVEPSSSALPAKTSIPPIPSAPSISSAPTVEDFQPPLPTPQDPYPGYYQLPSGSWAAYDPKYYKSFWDNWQTDFTSTGELDEGKKRGKGKGKVQMEGLQSVDAATELENGRLAELEKKKNLTTGILANAAALQQPRMAIRAGKAGGRAKSRHQLSTLLTEAYENRAALEERIADAKRNKKEAGSKYGF